MRLFFALWPDAALRRQLGALAGTLAQRAHGNAVPEAKAHMTLAFLGEVPVERSPAVCDAASRVEGEGFELVLDEVGSFRAAKVAWAGSSRGHPALIALQSSLAHELATEGFALESRPFAAHVTLVRRAASPIGRAGIEPMTWRVRDFALVASDTGRGTYEVGKTWELGARLRGATRP